LYVTYGGGEGQGVGGYAIKAVAGAYIAETLQACGIDCWEKLRGRTIYVVTDSDRRVVGIEPLPTETGTAFMFADVFGERDWAVEIPRRLVDAGARALCEDDSPQDPESWTALPDFHRDMYRETARLVLEAAFFECGVQEFVRVQFGDRDFRRYTMGGKWDERPVSHHLTRLMDTEENLVVERKLVIECFFEPLAVRNEEILWLITGSGAMSTVLGGAQQKEGTHRFCMKPVAIRKR
jgi:hypothetical protein